MSWHAVAVGVAKAGLLRELPGAVNGAKDFAAWARAQNYKTTLITDEEGPVLLGTIASAIADIIEHDFPERLLVFFAGHGAQQNVTTPVWLLSKWQSQNGEAINVEMTRFMASRSGIPRVAIFADACRNIIGEAATLSPLPIFPRRPSTKNPRAMTQCDLFFSCRFDEISQEVGVNADSSKAFGIFTRCLRSALNGEETDAIEPCPPPPNAIAVTSRKLATFLDGSVPRESGRVPGGQVQFPEIWPVWREPDQAYSIAPFPRSVAATNTQAGIERGKVRGAETTAASTADFGRESEFEKFSRLAVRDKITRAERKSDQQLQALMQELEAASANRETKLQTGLRIVGDTPRQVVVAGVGALESENLLKEDGAFQIRVKDDRPRSAAVCLQSGSWVAAVCLPGYVGTIFVRHGVMAGLCYVSEVDQWLAELDAQQRAAVNRWTALMHQGRVPAREELQARTDNLRQYKHFNPSLGLFAAYGYERLGDAAEIVNLAGYLVQIEQPILFDVAMLCDAPMKRHANGALQIEATLPLCVGQQTTAIAGSFPLLSRGLESAWFSDRCSFGQTYGVTTPPCSCPLHHILGKGW